MDLVSNRTIDITKLAMDGLMVRQKAITANIANVMTPDYQRKDVDFEEQLRNIVQKEDLKTALKEQNSLQYNPTSLEGATGAGFGLMPQQSAFLQTNSYDNYNPQISDDVVSGSDMTGNNVDLEKEVMAMTNVGLRYQTLSALESKQLRMISGAIKGDLS